MCEWLKQQVSKTCKPQGFEGSNPSPSVFKTPFSGRFFIQREPHQLLDVA